MYRYGDGSPFPLDENFIETLTAAVETCTNAFIPLTELDARRTKAKDTRREGDLENARLTDLEKSITGVPAAYTSPDLASVTPSIAQKLATVCKQTIAEAKRQIDARVQAVEAQAAGNTSADAVLKALRPFFGSHQLPKSQWIMSWDVRGNEPHADAVATAGKIQASFTLSPEQFRGPIRVEQIAHGVIVHMMRRGVFGKAKPAPVDLGKYVIVAFERTGADMTITLKENPHRASTGLRFAVSPQGATWVTISGAGDAEGEPNDLDTEDVAPIRQLADRAYAELKVLLQRRTLVDLSLGGRSIVDLDEPQAVPLELLAQLTPLSRSIRDKSRMSGELVLKKDIGDGRREELFVPRATLAQRFARLPYEYRRPFEDMGISGEQTQPAIQLPMRPPARPQFDTQADADQKTQVDDD
jgi:hypothetical protein